MEAAILLLQSCVILILFVERNALKSELKEHMRLYHSNPQSTSSTNDMSYEEYMAKRREQAKKEGKYPRTIQEILDTFDEDDKISPS